MSNNDLPCSKCRGQHHPADECVNTPEMKYTDWVRVLRKLSTSDCVSNSCMFGGKGKGGMRTNGSCCCVDAIAEQILADRARIVEPLQNFTNRQKVNGISNIIQQQTLMLAEKAIDESLRRAGRKDV